MKYLRIALITLLLTGSGKLIGQVAVSYFPIQSIVAISSSTENLLWADLRVQTNTFISNTNTECNAMLNLTRGTWVNYYTGVGIQINPFNGSQDLPLTNGYVAFAGARIKPIQKIPKLHLVFELSPYVNRDLEGVILRSHLGISYNF